MESKVKGLVKGVPSGDSVIISGKLPKSGDGIPEEINLYLTGIQAPKCGNTARLNDEEPFAWDSRNFLRKMLAGKVASYKIDYTVNDRKFGQVFIDNKNAAIEMVSNGYAKIGYIPKDKESILKSDYWKNIKNAEEKARNAKMNIWSDNKENKRNLINITDSSFDLENIKKLIKEQKEIEAIVEYVFNCAFLSLYIPSLNAFCKFNLRFLAIPSAKDAVLNKAGKAYVERICLSQDIKIIIHHIDDQKTLSGDAICGKGNIAELVLKEGYSKIFVNNTIPYSADDLNKMNLFQQEAKMNRLRIWKNEPISQGENKSKKALNEEDLDLGEVFCLCVNSGDSITVMNKNGEPTRIFLSNLKAPSFAKPNTNEQDQPWAFQAKEYLRRILVGRKIKCIHDYSKVTQKDDRMMNFYTVYHTVDNKKSKDYGIEKCINVELCENGYATLTTYEIDNGHPTQEVENMMNGEQSAKEKKVGIHSKKIPPIINYSDLIIASKAKKKEFISFLIGLSDTKCVVDFCFSGYGYKLRLDEKQVMIPFKLAGIKTFVKDKNNTDLFDKYFKMSLNYVNDTILQRDGVCEIEQADKVGNYFGNFFFNGENFAIDLLSKGFAVVNEQSFTRCKFLDEYRKAEEIAHKKKIGIWENEDLANLLKYGEGGASASNKFNEINKNIKFRVTEYIDFHNFYGNVLPNQTLDKIEKILSAYDRNKSKCIPLELPIKNGTLCAAKYPEDNKYYRAVIQNKTKEGKFRVRFIDYGNEEILPQDSLIKLDGEVSPLPPQCLFCELSYLKYSKNSMEKAVNKYPNFADISLVLNAKICYNYSTAEGEKNGIIVYMSGEDIKKSYHSELMKIGYAKLDRSKKLPEYFNELNQIEKTAKEKGLGIWAENEETDYGIEEEEDGY
ncbi:MAG: thermonuclease family protein [archaeon]|nr:thermonuclease family protein [archaeon]